MTPATDQEYRATIRRHLLLAQGYAMQGGFDEVAYRIRTVLALQSLQPEPELVKASDADEEC